MRKYHFLFLLVFSLSLLPQSKGQECFFVKNVLDTLYQINPSTGALAAYGITPDFPGQNFYGYLSSIDPIGRRYMYVTRLSDTSFDDFGLKIIQIDSQQISSVLLTGYENASPGLGQFSFHGLEYGAIADEVYMARVAGDSLYKIDMTTGAVSAVMGVPHFSNTYAYLHTFYQSEQRYAMIATDASWQKRFIQVDIDEDTVYVSPPMNFPEPIRGLEVSESTGEYYVVSDVDQMFYRIDPDSGSLTPLFPVAGYQTAFGYLHTYDFTTDQYLIVGRDTAQGLSLFSIFPGSNTVNQVPFPVPEAGYFGLEATNTLFIARMIEELGNTDTTTVDTTTTSIDQRALDFPFQLYPNPGSDWVQLEWKEREAVKIELLDVQGKVILREQFDPVSQVRLSISDLPKGAYLLRLTGKRGNRVGSQWMLVE